MDMTKYLESTVTLDVVRSSPTKSIVFVSAGVEKPMQDGKMKPSFVVDMDGKQLNYIPNKTTIKRLAAAYGKDSGQWVGKTMKVECGLVNQKDAILGTPQ